MAYTSFKNKTVSPDGKGLQKEFIVSTDSFHNITGVKTLLTNRKNLLHVL